MDQLSITFAEPRRVETLAARANDPISSHLAADEHTRSGKRAAQQALVVSAVRAFPGKTMQELSELSGICRFTLGRRISECETGGAVRRLPARKCSVTGRMAEPWEPV